MECDAERSRRRRRLSEAPAIHGMPLSDLLPWKMSDTPGDNFWDLHRRLGECYEAEVQLMRTGSGAPLSEGRESREGRRKAKSRAHTTQTDPVGLARAKLSRSGTAPSFKVELLRGGIARSPLGDDGEAVVNSSQGSLNIIPEPESVEQSARSLPRQRSPGFSVQEELQVPSEDPPMIPYVSKDSASIGCFLPRSCWTTKSKNRQRRGTTNAIFRSSAVVQESTFYVLNPFGHFRNFWDFVGIIFLILDSIILPLQFVNDELYSTYPYLEVNARVAVFYWLADIILSFFTGYLEKVTLIQDNRKIIMRYLRTWFVPDLIVTAIDLVLEFSNGGDTDRASTRILRLLRLFRVVRLGKLTRFAVFLRDTCETQVASIQFSLVIIMTGMMLLEHVLACGWFGVGYYDSANGRSWLQENNLKEETFYKQYTASLRWSFSQLGIGGTNIEATNEREGTYSIAVSVISLVTFSTIVSAMTSLVSALQSQRMEETQQFGLLRRFLRVNKIPHNLGARITRFLQYTYHQRETNSHDPYILDYLSKSLQAELQFARYSDCLSQMHFLEQLLSGESTQEDQIMQTLAQRAIAVLDSAEDDVVFCSGFKADATYFAINGALCYVRTGATPSSLSSEQWVAEMCLWTDWYHVGDLLSISFAKLVAINVEEFCAIIGSAGTVQAQAHEYAISFVDALNQQLDLSDLWRMSPPKARPLNVKERWHASFFNILGSTDKQVVPCE
ncbi:Potassium/sodium hyperpolarization-activated cyclic nucleotide-gated channel 4 (Hyperpolarization-activated cation channel 4) (HAC-4) [Durusdinium trenchii]|uniref:Potassium/sodium hyperpolarization-activated cyclic nucleotide-gated channel 4 (Hyperpolarization-activated cation channel 4) (HAC-4) n=1 Tax=Durusdinium trenchii TaxID=1381693 RepID=A0ABP0SCQ0_9DINO